MKATIDLEACTGCEECVSTCPEVFEMDPDSGKARTKVDEVIPDYRESCKKAAEECPAEAIKVE